ncbi:F-box/LRR-repeat protein [Spatholobus suberectus]|nr:F-box/LRR-repeat protein [Spatholobus suberectus]
MENSNSVARKDCNDFLCKEILVTIFMSLNVADLAVASRVCKFWNRACRDPSLWHKLDLSRLSSSCFTMPNRLKAWDDKHSSTKMTHFMKYVLSLSNGNTTCLVFNYYVYLRDMQFITAAESTPNLKQLVLPKTGFLSMGGVNKAMKSWEGLESISISSVVPHHYIFPAIGKYCKNITEMKFTCDFEEYHVDAMIKYTPNLKVLSVRSIIVSMKALCRVLTFLKHLEVVNICHSLILDRSGRGSRVLVYGIRDMQNHLPPSSLGKLIFCQPGRCLRCKNGRDTTPSRQPYGPLEDIWHEDEITSLAH